MFRAFSVRGMVENTRDVCKREKGAETMKQPGRWGQRQNKGEKYL